MKFNAGLSRIAAHVGRRDALAVLGLGALTWGLWQVSPALAAVSDTRVLARLADATVFVVEWETTPRPVALDSFRSLKTSGARIAGVIMQKVNVRKSARYGYYEEAA